MFRKLVQYPITRTRVVAPAGGGIGVSLVRFSGFAPLPKDRLKLSHDSDPLPG